MIRTRVDTVKHIICLPLDCTLFRWLKTSLFYFRGLDKVPCNILASTNIGFLNLNCPSSNVLIPIDINFIFS